MITADMDARRKELENLTKPQLLSICKTLNVYGSLRFLKKTLIQNILDTEGLHQESLAVQPSITTRIEDFNRLLEVAQRSGVDSEILKETCADLKQMLSNYDFTGLEATKGSAQKLIEEKMERLQFRGSGASKSEVSEIPELQQDLSDLMKQLGLSIPKRSIQFNMVKVQDALKRVSESTSVEEITRLHKELSGYLQTFDWTGHELFKDSVRSTLQRSQSRFPAESKKEECVFEKKVRKKRPDPIDYRPIDLSGVTITKSKNQKAKRLEITLEQFRPMVDDPSFIKKFTQSSKDLMGAKVNFYTDLLAKVKVSYASMKEKITKLKLTGIEDSTIKEYYPDYHGLGVSIFNLEDLILLVKDRLANTTEASIKKGLLEAIDDTEKGLASLVGRAEVKDKIASQLYSFSMGYQTFFGAFNNIAIYGPSGVGKTMLAKVIAFVFSKAGILAKGTVRVITRVELIAQYIGQTAARTRGVLLESLEALLFLDEAYQLSPHPSTTSSLDFGAEAMAEMVNFLDKYIGMSILIVAGYEMLMKERFMTFNEGLPRRFPHRYILNPYSNRELTDILMINLKNQLPETFVIDEATANFLYSMVVKVGLELSEPFKNQAGDMLNLSGSLNRAISSSFAIKWENGDLEHNIPILASGFQSFLEEL